MLKKALFHLIGILLFCSSITGFRVTEELGISGRKSQISFSRSQDLYQKVIHNTDPEAKCLDGSPGLLYVHQGGEADKFFIFFQGGGFCGDDSLAKTTQNCYQRSKTSLGSSTLWPDTIQGHGYLSTNPQTNKFANWTKVIFGYCDGSLHQGRNNASVKYKEAQLYFRGADITRSHFKWLDTKYKLSQGKNIVITGASAGASGALYWTNYLQALVKTASAVSTIADSGVFMNARTHQAWSLKIQTQFKNLWKLSNTDQNTPIHVCNAFYNTTEWKCLFLQYGYATIEGRILLINSEYDQAAILKILNIPCLKAGKSGLTLSSCSSSQLNQIQKYRAEYKQFVSQYLQFSKNNIWSIACSNHIYASLDEFYNVSEQKVPASIGSTVKDAVERFVFQKKRVTDIDTEAWPSNTPCAY